MQPQSAASNQTVVNAYSSEAQIRRIRVKVLLAPDIPPEQIKAIRDVVTSSIPFNPLRGDEIDVQNSTLLKPMSAAATTAATASPNERILDSFRHETNVLVGGIVRSRQRADFVFAGRFQPSPYYPDRIPFWPRTGLPEPLAGRSASGG